MKKKFLPGLLMALGLGSLLSSCAKEVCYRCSYTYGNTTYRATLCREDFASEAEFKAYVAEYRSYGAECKETKIK
jgi:hypothetical protein